MKIAVRLEGDLLTKLRAIYFRIEHRLLLFLSELFQRSIDTAANHHKYLPLTQKIGNHLRAELPKLADGKTPHAHVVARHLPRVGTRLIQLLRDPQDGWHRPDC